MRLAAGLAALELGHGDRVAIWLPDGPSRFMAQEACARLGAVVVTVDPGVNAHELGDILKESGSRALLLTDHLGGIDYFEVLHEVLPALLDAIPGELEFAAFPELTWVIVDADDEYPGCIRLRDVADAGDDPVWSAADNTGPRAR